MTCQHQFFKIQSLVEYDKAAPTIRVENEGVQIACGLCGEVRHIWKDGKIEIKVNGK